MPFCWFCHDAAQISTLSVSLVITSKTLMDRTGLCFMNYFYALGDQEQKNQ